MIENGNIDTSMKKWGIADFSWCVEHTTVLRQIKREVKTKDKNFAVAWLALANACRSEPHKLIGMAMDLYHIPDHTKKLVQHYYGGI